ncbi:hypothetical protein VP01_10g3 [Puccinia sorghi]|uniref:Large ribosomal subunit protein mL49 n=1 Tax=Puccinia sorghi TaxID=27349 RepID=A0A0L6VSX1_9BASI|nr:hypothetical protein VP01_10g3 [Puccinia sorghi]
MASATSVRTVSRLITISKPHAFLLRGRDGVAQRRCSTREAAIPEKPAGGSEPSLNTVSPSLTHALPSSPKKVYKFDIPDRVWKAPIHSKENPLKYSINRTVPYSTLPVYSVMKPGLGQIWTLIKKIDGDLLKLKEDLILDFPQSRPIIKPKVKHVLCRGQIVKEVKLWLQDRGF